MTEHSERVRGLFDAKSASWSDKYAPGGRLEARLERFVSALDRALPAGSRVLDFGCGTGDLAAWLAHDGYVVTACDFSVEMMLQLPRNGPRLTTAVLDVNWSQLPFKTALYDAVIASSVLEYVADVDAVLAEFARVLRPGGVLLATVPDSRHPVRTLERVLAAATRRIENVPTGRVARYLTYTLVSRQRHSRDWWSDAARRANLVDLSCADERLQPLMMLTLRRRA